MDLHLESCGLTGTRAALRLRELDIGVDELCPAAQLRSWPPPAMRFNSLRLPAVIVWVLGGRGAMYAELAPSICIVNHAV